MTMWINPKRILRYRQHDSASTNGYASNFMSVFDNYAVAVQGSNLNVSVNKPDVYNGNTIYEHPVSGHPVATSVEQDVACSIDEQHCNSTMSTVHSVAHMNGVIGSDPCPVSPLSPVSPVSTVSAIVDNVVPEDSITTVGEGAGVDGQTGALPSYFMNDSNKRPLSISSTSSGASSVSSLPRHQRKKRGGLTASSVISPTGRVHSNLCDDLMKPAVQDTDTDNNGNARTPCTLPESDDEQEHQDIEIDAEAEQRMEQCLRHLKEYDQCVPNPGLQYGLLPVQDTCDGSSAVDRLADEDVFDGPNNSTLVQTDGDSSTAGSTSSPLHGTYIERVVYEIVCTERVYVEDLQQIIQGYVQSIRSAEHLHISEANIDILFGNIQQIYNFNSAFLDDLEGCDLDPIRIAACFVHHNGGFVIYTDYCTNYPSSMKIMTELMNQPHISEVFKTQQVLLQHALPLGAYLLKPVQRILKYHLLLENILSHFGKSDAGYDIIQSALSSMTHTAQHINEMKRKHEHTIRIHEIQSLLCDWDGDDLTTCGDLVLEESFKLCGAKGLRQLFLFEKGLIIAKRRDDGGMLVKTYIVCSNLMLVESIPGEPLSFHVIPFDNPRLQNTVKCRNMEQKKRWCVELKRLILESYSTVIPDKVKELVMTLGKSKEEQDFQDSPFDCSTSKKQSHNTPQYLEKRMRRRKSTTILPDFGLLKGRRGTKKDANSPAILRRRSEIPSTLSVSIEAFTRRLSYESNSSKRLLPHAEDCNSSVESVNTGEQSPSVAMVKPEVRSASLIVPDIDGRETSYDDTSERAKRVSLLMEGSTLEEQLQKLGQDIKDTESTKVTRQRANRRGSARSISDITPMLPAVAMYDEIVTTNLDSTLEHDEDDVDYVYLKAITTPNAISTNESTSSEFIPRLSTLISQEPLDLTLCASCKRQESVVTPLEKCAHKHDTEIPDTSADVNPWLPQTHINIPDGTPANHALKKSSSFSAVTHYSIDVASASTDHCSDSVILRKRRTPHRQSSLLKRKPLGRSASDGRGAPVVRSVSDNRGSCAEAGMISRHGINVSDESFAFTDTSSPSCSGSRSMRSDLDDYIRTYGDSSLDCSENDDIDLHHVDQLRKTFKNVVSSIAHRLNRQSSAPNYSSSSVQLYDGHLDHTIEDSINAKKHNMVYNLARTYSNRIKRPNRYYKSQNTSDNQVHTLSEYPADSNLSLATKNNPQLASLMKMNQLGSANIGARMASGKVSKDGNYTLPRKGSSRRYVEQDEHENPSDAETGGIQGDGAMGHAINPSESQIIDPQTPETEDTDDAIFSLPSDSDDSSLYYYEQRLAEALDDDLESGSFRDSAVYSDDGFLSIPTQDTGTCKISIKDTIQLIEHSLQAKPVQKIEVKITEKAKCIKDILRSLESQNNEQSLNAEELFDNKMLLKSIPDRTRELIECATLTRIRQDSLAVTEERTSESDLTTLRKGWVKQVVELLQCDDPSALTQSCDPSLTQPLWDTNFTCTQDESEC